MPERDQIFKQANLIPVKGMHRIPSWAKRVKLDVGLGPNAPMMRQWLKEDQHLFVIGVEASSQNVSSVVSILESEGLAKRAWVLQCGLGERNAVGKLQLAADPGQSSFISHKGTNQKHIQLFESVNIVSLDSLLCRVDFGRLNRIDYLKTDCQGTDLEVLKGAKKSLERVAVVTCEAWAPNYRSRRPDKTLVISSFLKANGFSPVQRSPRFVVALHNSIFYRITGSIVEPYLVAIQEFLKKNRMIPINSSQDAGTNFATDPTYVNQRFLGDLNSGAVNYWQNG